MLTAIIAHHARELIASRLETTISADNVFMDYGDHGASWNHRRALEWAATCTERVLVIEDDALPVPDFRQLAATILDHYPDDLVSLYLGTGRPPQYQQRIASALADDPEKVTLPTLIHAVAYSIPTPMVATVVQNLRTDLPIDYAIGNAWRALTRRDTIYTMPSLVDHLDIEPVERHRDGQLRTEQRRAWRLYACQ